MSVTSLDTKLTPKEISTLNGLEERPIYRQSMINMFLRCGLQFFYRYIEGRIVPPSGALTVGSAVHFGVAFNQAQKIHTNTDLPVQDVLDVYSTDFDKRKTETEWQDDDPGEQKDLGASLLEAHHVSIAPQIEPKTVEENFTINLDGEYDLTGTIDLTTKDGIVVDTKTSRSKYSDDAAYRSVQPAVYDFAYEAIHGERAKGFRYDVLIKSKKPQVQQVNYFVTDDDRNWLFQTIDSVHKAIKAGVFLPAPEGSWVCSEKWCGYWHSCKGKKNGK